MNVIANVSRKLTVYDQQLQQEAPEEVEVDHMDDFTEYSTANRSMAN